MSIWQPKQKALYALKEKTKSTVGYLPPKFSIKMFDTHILPILEYNSYYDSQRSKLKPLRKYKFDSLKTCSVLGGELQHSISTDSQTTLNRTL